MANHESKPFILGLPNETLTEILKCFARSGQPTMPILVVCHRFHQLGIPVFYRYYKHTLERLKLSSSENKPRLKPHIDKLQRTLQKEPELGKYCRDLCICSNDGNDTDWDDSNAGNSDPFYNPNNFPILQTIASNLPNVHSLELYNGLGMDMGIGCYSPKNRDTWCLFRRCVESMPSLRTVSLRGRMHSLLDGRELMDTLKGTSVRRLILHGFEFGSTWSWTSQVSSQELGRSCINELDLELYHERPEVTACLLEWPKALTSLRFKNNCSMSEYIDLPMLGSMLRKHKDSLVKLSIGSLSPKGMGKLFDFSAFGAMEELDLVMQQIVSEWPAKFSEEDYSFLLPPNLRILKIGFLGGQKDTYSHFDDRAGSWLRGFAKAAARQRIPLQNIVIDIPSLLPKRSQSVVIFVRGRSDAPNPGQFVDGIEALEKDLRSMGIAVTY